MPHIGDAYDDKKVEHRSHLGASMSGKECSRAIWYGWRWALPSAFEGRMIRLFNRGHIEEARFLAMLLMIGVQVYQQDSEGKQFVIRYAEGHAGGSGDGVASGIPDLPAGLWALLEFKTHNEKSFAALLKDGVRKSKLPHYIQSNIYMRKMGLTVCLYLAINKNTDELYGEIIPLDIELADQYMERSNRIVWMQQEPPKINPSPGYWKCRFCDYRPVCHLKQQPEKNCRTCVYSQPVRDATWFCSFHQQPLPKNIQLTGCNNYKRLF